MCVAGVGEIETETCREKRELRIYTFVELEEGLVTKSTLAALTGEPDLIPSTYIEANTCL